MVAPEQPKGAWRWFDWIILGVLVGAAILYMAYRVLVGTYDT